MLQEGVAKAFVQVSSRDQTRDIRNCSSVCRTVTNVWEGGRKVWLKGGRRREEDGTLLDNGPYATTKNSEHTPMGLGAQFMFDMPIVVQVDGSLCELHEVEITLSHRLSMVVVMGLATTTI